LPSIWLYTIGSVLIVSTISLIGAVVLLLKKESLKSVLLFMVAFSAGALLGDAFIHLIPEAVSENGLSMQTSLLITVGILIFFILEKIVHWRHCHQVGCPEHIHHLGIMNFVGDGVHNAIDGMVIAGSFMLNTHLGITTTIAVILHEIPQEIGDFGVLLYSGIKPKKALMLNFISALFAVLGAVVILLVGMKAENLTQIIIPITAGGFIYIAGTDLIPELHKEVKLSKSLVQFGAILMGIGLMAGLLVME
jgi:zinc and cadmium transporter